MRQEQPPHSLHPTQSPCGQGDQRLELVDFRVLGSQVVQVRFYAERFPGRTLYQFLGQVISSASTRMKDGCTWLIAL